MGKTVAFANQKGGVGKTTSAVNTAAALGFSGYSTLLVDLDPQGSATSGVGVAKKDLRHTVRDLLVGGCWADDVILHTKYEKLDLIPSNIALAGAEFDLLDGEGAEGHLTRALERVLDRYEYIIIDCPPSLGMLTINAMMASENVIIPLQCEYYALEGLTQLTATIGRLKKRFHPSLTLTGILVTMYQGRLSLTQQVLAELQKHYGDRLFETKISRNVRLSEAPSFGQPAIYYDKRSKGAKEYLAFAAELRRRIG